MSDTNFKMLCVASDKNAALIINLNKIVLIILVYRYLRRTVESKSTCGEGSMCVPE